MIDHQYKRLAKHLTKTRKTLQQACRELGIDVEEVDYYDFDKHCCQCTHCDIWGTDHKPDLDANPICTLCFRLVGE
jgi:multimeric flavodoxin WrbA